MGAISRFRDYWFWGVRWMADVFFLSPFANQLIFYLWFPGVCQSPDFLKSGDFHPSQSADFENSPFERVKTCENVGVERWNSGPYHRKTRASKCIFFQSRRTTLNFHGSTGSTQGCTCMRRSLVRRANRGTQLQSLETIMMMLIASSVLTTFGIMWNSTETTWR